MADIERSLRAQEAGAPFVLSLPALSPAGDSKDAPADQRAWFDKLTTNVSGTQQAVLISAARRWNLDALLKAVERELQAVRAAGRATA